MWKTVIDKINIETIGNSLMQEAHGLEYHTFMGLKVLVDAAMIEVIEDWSDCRSPSRARRRLKRSFPQHVRYSSVIRPPIQNGEYIIMHPKTARDLQREHQNNAAHRGAII